jgi:hypothetical protein
MVNKLETPGAEKVEMEGIGSGSKRVTRRKTVLEKLYITAISWQYPHYNYAGCCSWERVGQRCKYLCIIFTNACESTIFSNRSVTKKCLSWQCQRSPRY